MMTAVWALPVLPAIAAAVGLPSHARGRRPAIVLGLAGTGAALLCALGLTITGAAGAHRATLADFGDVRVGLSVHFDGTTAAVALAVALVAFLVQLYSVAYTRADDRYAPYAAQISLFTAAMLLVVVADDLVLLLIGWEVMGACSYLLIGHDRRLPAAPGAAVKAFLVTRVGDIGFLLGVVLLGVRAGTFHIPSILDQVGELGGATVITAALLLLAGAIGKSAQFPLHSWLPDAMAGPTPVSALIHAATMVAAGAYLLFRLEPLFLAVDAVTTVIAVCAAITMLGAACAALASDDLKRVLAWSTVSQVGFMFGGIAVAAGDAAIAHLLAHAAFKALLFLGAGIVITWAASNSMTAMGGLRHGAPVTFWTMTIGFAALAGIPPTSGFFGKELILSAAYESTTPAGAVIWWAGVVTVALTAGYATRGWLRIFFGRPRGDTAPGDPEPLLRLPLLVLAVPAAAWGLLSFTFTDTADLHIAPTLLVLAATVIGAGGCYLRWRRDPAADPANALGAAGPVFARGFGFDTLQDRLITRPVLALASFARRADARAVDGGIEAGADATVRLAGRIADLHGGLPRHLLATLSGAVAIAALAVAAYWGVLS